MLTNSFHIKSTCRTFKFPLSTWSPKRSSKSIVFGGCSATGVSWLTLSFRICSICVFDCSSLSFSSSLNSLLPFHNFLIEHFWTFWKISIFIHIIHYFLLKLFSIFSCIYVGFPSFTWDSWEIWLLCAFPVSPQCSEEMTSSGSYSVPTSTRFVPREDSHTS